MGPGRSYGVLVEFIRRRESRQIDLDRPQQRLLGGYVTFWTILRIQNSVSQVPWQHLENGKMEQKQNKKELKATDNYWMDTIFNTVKVNFQNLGNFISLDSLDISPVMLVEPIYKYKDLYEIDKDMKLEPEIFNYVDHPYFSILIRVKEISN